MPLVSRVRACVPASRGKQFDWIPAIGGAYVSPANKHSAQFTGCPANRNPQPSTRKQCNSHWPSHLPLTLSRCSSMNSDRGSSSSSSNRGWQTATAVAEAPRREGQGDTVSSSSSSRRCREAIYFQHFVALFYLNVVVSFFFWFLNFVYTYTYVNSSTVYLCVGACVWECVWVSECVWARVCLRVCVRVWVYVHGTYEVRVHVCVHFCACVYVCVWVCVYVCVLRFSYWIYLRDDIFLLNAHLKNK